MANSLDGFTSKINTFFPFTSWISLFIRFEATEGVNAFPSNDVTFRMNLSAPWLFSISESIPTISNSSELSFHKS